MVTVEWRRPLMVHRPGDVSDLRFREASVGQVSLPSLFSRNPLVLQMPGIRRRVRAPSIREGQGDGSRSFKNISMGMIPSIYNAFSPGSAPYDSWATVNPWPPSEQEGYVHTLKRVGADDLNCQIDRRTGQLLCEGRMTGCFPMPDGSVKCGPGQSLGLSPEQGPGILVGLGLTVALVWGAATFWPKRRNPRRRRR